jgi:predicted ATPase/DNA-binding XRE family transcriptional regulator
MSETFGNWVKQRRKALGLSQSELAERIACSPETIKKIESHRRRPSRQIADLLMRELQIEASERDRFMVLARGIESAQNDSPEPVFPVISLAQPSPMTPLIDRSDEATAISDLVRRPEVCLVTLTGSGGVGKTRLALQTNQLLHDDFAHGIYLISLADVTQAHMLLTIIAQAFNIHAPNEQMTRQRLIDFLQGKQMLLTLDNFEQVLPAAGEVATLLEALPETKIMVTSRARLNLSGEYEYVVPPMRLPDLSHLPAASELAAISPAVNLFVQRVDAIRPGFQLTEQNARPVAEICALLDGIPLAIELAAARCKLLDPPELLERLRHSPVLNLLTQGAQNLPPRQQTIRQTIDWSYNLLGATEQRLFERMGVFVGGATLETIETVCGESDTQILDTLTTLMNWNLIWREEHPHLPPRFQMLATLREYAIERLTARDELTIYRRRYALRRAEVAKKTDNLDDAHMAGLGLLPEPK